MTEKGPKKAISITVVTHYYDGHGGGIERVACKLIQSLIAAGGFSFTWAASDCDPAPALDALAKLPMRTFNGIEKLLGIPMPLWGIGSLRRLRAALCKSDVLWLHDTLYLGNIIAFLFARLAGKPVVVTQHIAPIPYNNRVVRWLMRWADRLITTTILKKADEVVFISDRVAEDYYGRTSFIRPIKVIPNGVDMRLFHPAIEENRRFLRQNFALRNDQPVLLFVGRFVEKKGLEVLRRLASLLPEWRFWLAGQGPMNPTTWLLPNVHVFSNRKGQSLADLYQAADLLVLPSYGEGFPLVVQEAMACGLPVLCAPETAQGCAAAVPYLHLADVWAENPERTAAVWHDVLKTFPMRLPLEKPDKKSADFALASWDWPPIARVYADLLEGLLRRKAPAKS